jgi:lipoate-protein ligase A
MMQILDTGIDTAEANMLNDLRLLENLAESSVPILHLYQWAKPSATFGYFIKPENHLDLQKIARHSIDLARRPTGGGIVFHIWDLAFSFLMPSHHPAFSFNTLDNYAFVNRAVLEVVHTYFSLTPEMIVQDGNLIGADCQNFCMARPTQYDVVYQGVKIAGAAQRRRKQGYLHQGTISLAVPDLSLLKEVLLSKEDVVRAMGLFTFSPIQDYARLSSVRKDLQKLLADKLRQSLIS